MKTARTALLLVMMLVLVACTERQRRTAMSAAANALLASLLDVQSSAPLTQSTFRASNAASTPMTEPVDAVEPEPAADETARPIRCPLAPLPFASTQLSDVAQRAAGVLDRIPNRNAARVAQAIACAQARAQVISRCRYIRIRDEKVKGTNRIVFRAEITVPGDAIELSGVDDRAL
ncbi:MAG: hypothetical protein QOI24_1567 [Acidobacteriota bacterium]|jgi:hypothetical protein|nr:hypothetical protein [Acidobacteriota bacterium]